MGKNRDPDELKLSFTSWMAGGSLVKHPQRALIGGPSKKAPAKIATAPPKPKTATEIKAEPKHKTNKKMKSEGTDSPEDALKKAQGALAKAQAAKDKEEAEQQKIEDANAKLLADAEAVKVKEAEELLARVKRRQAAEEAEKKKKADKESKKIEEDRKIAAAKKLIEVEEVAKKKEKEEKEAKDVAEQQNKKARFCAYCGKPIHDGKCGGDELEKKPGEKVAVVEVANVEKSKKAESVKSSKHHHQKTTISFNAEQDKQIFDMKKAGSGFNVIAIELGLTRKDVTDRYWQLFKEGKKADAEAQKKDESKDGLAKDEEDLGEIVMASMIDEEPKKPSEPNNYHKATVEDVPGNTDRKTNSSTDDTKKVDAAWAPIPGDPNCSIPDWSHGEQGQIQSKDFAALPPYILISPHATADPTFGKKILKPDAIWSVQDLEVLAEAEARHRELKWLHVQAGFWNVTGRLVDPMVIRQKFLEAEAEVEWKNGDGGE